MARHSDRVGGPFRTIAVVLFLTVAVGVSGVWSLGEHPPAWYPPCVFHASSGLHCPGCGTARAVHALAHGEFLAALHDNALLMLVLPMLVAWGVIALWRALRRNQPPLELPHGTARIVLVATIAFVVARNLPWWPCTLLAPVP